MKLELDRAIAVAEIALAAMRTLGAAVKAFSTAIDTGAAQLSSSLDEMKKGRDQLAADRAETDAAIDKKFDS